MHKINKGNYCRLEEKKHSEEPSEEHYSTVKLKNLPRYNTFS